MEHTALCVEVSALLEMSAEPMKIGRASEVEAYNRAGEALGQARMAITDAHAWAHAECVRRHYRATNG